MTRGHLPASILSLNGLHYPGKLGPPGLSLSFTVVPVFDSDLIKQGIWSIRTIHKKQQVQGIYMSILKALPVIILTLFMISACQEKGPMEKAGESMDEAVKDAGNAVEDACEDAKKNMGAADTDC